MSNIYENPLIRRYASQEMLELFSPDKKFQTWRKLWITLAESQQELGLSITDEQIKEMKAFEHNINFDRAREIEKKTRHDVMSHVHAFGEQCPSAMPIIHLGATSAFVGGNTDVIVMREALEIVRDKLVNVIDRLSKFSEETKAIPTLGFTHFQPAQLTTVGKRATLWNMDLVQDLYDIEYTIESLMLRGAKGTTGTQASYLNLFEGDHDKVEALDQLIADKLGFTKTFPVTGQTYSRKLDSRILNALSGLGQSMHKITNDLRLLQHLKEVEEPFEKNQIGSSAMAYKRNPMRSERIASLSRYLIANSMNPAMTVSTQWFERTLDDSANRRISLPESFLVADSILDIMNNVVSGLVVYEKVIYKHVMAELPFMATENIIMEAVKKGGDRQKLHETIRVHSMEAANQVKVHGLDNDLLSRIVKDETFGLNQAAVDQLTDPSLFIGRSSEQVDTFNKEVVLPITTKYSAELGKEADLKV